MFGNGSILFSTEGPLSTTRDLLFSPGIIPFITGGRPISRTRSLLPDTAGLLFSNGVILFIIGGPLSSSGRLLPGAPS